MSRGRRHAEDTRVPVARSREQIGELLRSWGCQGVRWTDELQTGCARLEFTWGVDTMLHARLELVVPDGAKDEERERRRLHRVLRVYLLGQFEAIEAGMFDLDEAMLPHLVLANGQTMAQNASSRLPEIAAGADPLALPEGRS